MADFDFASLYLGEQHEEQVQPQEVEEETQNDGSTVDSDVVCLPRVIFSLRPTKQRVNFEEETAVPAQRQQQQRKAPTKGKSADQTLLSDENAQKLAFFRTGVLRLRQQPPAELSIATEFFDGAEVAEFREELRKRRHCDEEMRKRNAKPKNFDDLDNDGAVEDSTPWSEKYRPTSYFDLVSAESANRRALSFVSRFLKRQDIRASGDENALALMLHGVTASGKSTLAQVLARHFNCQLVTLNASDQRSEKELAKRVGTASEHASFFNSEKSDENSDRNEERPVFVLLEEMDGADIRAHPASPLIKTLRSNFGAKRRCVVCCVCEDAFAPSLRFLRRQCFLVRLARPTTRQISRRVGTILSREWPRLKFDLDALDSVVSDARNDIRAVLNRLQISVAHVHTDDAAGELRLLQSHTDATLPNSALDFVRTVLRSSQTSARMRLIDMADRQRAYDSNDVRELLCAAFVDSSVVRLHEATDLLQHLSLEDASGVRPVLALSPLARQWHQSGQDTLGGTFAFLQKYLRRLRERTQRMRQCGTSHTVLGESEADVHALLSSCRTALQMHMHTHGDLQHRALMTLQAARQIVPPDTVLSLASLASFGRSDKAHEQELLHALSQATKPSDKQQQQQQQHRRQYASTKRNRDSTLEPSPVAFHFTKGHQSWHTRPTISELLGGLNI